MADPLPLPRLQADQFPVTGDTVWIRAEFHSIHCMDDGVCYVKIRLSNSKSQHIYVRGDDVFAQLRVGHVLETYGQQRPESAR